MANTQSDFASAPPEVAVQLHEGGEESSICFDLLLSVSIYYFSGFVTSGFRFVFESHVDLCGRIRPKTGPWSTGTNAGFAKHLRYDDEFGRRRARGRPRQAEKSTM
jgi:hypothetical protein